MFRSTDNFYLMVRPIDLLWSNLWKIQEIRDNIFHFSQKSYILNDNTFFYKNQIFSAEAWCA